MYLIIMLFLTIVVCSAADVSDHPAFENLQEVRWFFALVYPGLVKKYDKVSSSFIIIVHYCIKNSEIVRHFDRSWPAEAGALKWRALCNVSSKQNTNR